jgi:hypothetical protein
MINIEDEDNEKNNSDNSKAKNRLNEKIKYENKKVLLPNSFLPSLFSSLSFSPTVTLISSFDLFLLIRNTLDSQHSSLIISSLRCFFSLLCSEDSTIHSSLIAEEYFIPSLSSGSVLSSCSSGLGNNISTDNRVERGGWKTKKEKKSEDDNYNTIVDDWSRIEEEDDDEDNDEMPEILNLDEKENSTSSFKLYSNSSNSSLPLSHILKKDVITGLLRSNFMNRIRYLMEVYFFPKIILNSHVDENLSSNEINYFELSSISHFYSSSFFILSILITFIRKNASSALIVAKTDRLDYFF